LFTFAFANDAGEIPNVRATGEAADWPFPFTAVTTQKYAVPLLSPVTTAEVALAPLTVALAVPDVDGGFVVEQ
jgi:hypothetical protein